MIHNVTGWLCTIARWMWGTVSKWLSWWLRIWTGMEFSISYSFIRSPWTDPLFQKFSESFPQWKAIKCPVKAFCVIAISFGRIILWRWTTRNGQKSFTHNHDFCHWRNDSCRNQVFTFISTFFNPKSTISSLISDIYRRLSRYKQLGELEPVARLGVLLRYKASKLCYPLL